jgi:hypothetical protein
MKYILSIIIILLLFCVPVGAQQSETPVVNITLIGGAFPDSLAAHWLAIVARVQYADTGSSGLLSSASKTGFLNYPGFVSFTLAATRAGLLVADSTKWNATTVTVNTDSVKWNLAYSTVAADSTNWNLAYTLSVLFVADSTKWNTAYSERRQWDGGTTNLVVGTAWTSLGLKSMAGSDSTWGWMKKSDTTSLSTRIDLKLNVSDTINKWLLRAETNVNNWNTAADRAALIVADTNAWNLKGTNYTKYASGTAYSLTASSAALDFGTTDPLDTLVVGGTYFITSRVLANYAGATFAAGDTVEFNLYRTNNTPGVIANSTTDLCVPILTTATYTIGSISLPGVIYTATAGDILTLYGKVYTAPGAGNVNVTEASIVAIKLY